MNEKRHNKIVLNLKRCIEETFSYENWDELAYLTNGKDIIHEHPRLLRSLNFGDEDYGSCIFPVLEELLSKDDNNLGKIETYTKLPEWLKKNNQKEYEAIYGHTRPMLSTVDSVATTNSFEINQYIIRINNSVETDPELAIGSTKEMLESVLKTIIEGFGELVGKEDLPALLKRTQKLLNLDPKNIDLNSKGAEITKRTLSNLSQVVVGLNELRNIYGTGHGKVRRSGISARHAKLVVGAGATLAIFLMETFEFHQADKNA